MLAVIITFSLVVCYSGAINSDLCNDEKASIYNCYSNIGVDIGDPASYITRSERFFPVCDIGNMSRLIECYDNVLDHCPGYRDNGPDIMAKDVFKAFLIGTCVNQLYFVRGFQCVGVATSLMHAYANEKCINSTLQSNVWDAYIQMGDWTWDKYCSLMKDGIECSVNRLNEFDCGQPFYDFLRHSTYIRLAPECQEPNSTHFRWLQIYTEIPERLAVPDEKLTDSSSQKIIVDLFLTLCCLFYCIQVFYA